MNRRDGQFATTRWSLVRAAGGDRSAPEVKSALTLLCEAYWYPLYAEARRRGLSTEDASDRTQAFFARMIEKGDLAVADRRRGRFRSFLLAAFDHFLANEWDRERALKRGGGRPIASLDADLGESRYVVEPSHQATAERLFDRRWALTLIGRALERLRDEQVAAGKAEPFDVLKGALAGDRGVSYAELAAQLGTTEGAIKVAVHRLRGRCRELIRDEIAQTVGSAEEVDDELRQLFAALGAS
jgi:RNA polymerase sigma-70 factor (ECF subfamily)